VLGVKRAAGIHKGVLLHVSPPSAGAISQAPPLDRCFHPGRRPAAPPPSCVKKEKNKNMKTQQKKK